jgi:hypothetical protein
MTGVIIFLATTFAVYSVLRLFGVLDITTTSTKAKTTIETARKENKSRKKEQQKLKMFSTLTDMFKGLLMNDLIYDNHKYYIDRLEIKSEVLGRQYTPEELRGKYAFPFVLSLILIPLSVFLPWILLVPVACFVYFMTYQTIYKMRIQDEDEIIDNYFIDLYLLLYSKLKQGSRARLQGTVENYIDTLEGQASTEVRDTMLKLAKYLLNLLALYEDHVAIPKLREAYHSATIINFCNVATQSLNGIENADNLLSFKIQLTDRKTELMRKRQQKILRSGERSIYLIWIILFIFVIVGWYSKLPTGMF